MARPIKETPTLYGADARRFEQLIANTKTASAEERANLKETYERFKAIANFPMQLMYGIQ